MACGVALKRPYDAYLSPDDVTDAKRRCTNTGCSPFRPFLGTLAASLPNTASREGLLKNASPFAAAANHLQLSPGQLQSYLKAEVRSLKRRRLLPKRLFLESTSGENNAGGSSYGTEIGTSLQQKSHPASCHSTGGYRVPTHSPTANLGSDSDDETTATINERQMSIFEKPQFSLKQVQLVCERLLKQQEITIRCEYESKLNKLLKEQHEQFVQFTREQERQQSSSSAEEFSYYS